MKLFELNWKSYIRRNFSLWFWWLTWWESMHVIALGDQCTKPPQCTKERIWPSQKSSNSGASCKLKFWGSKILRKVTLKLSNAKSVSIYQALSSWINEHVKNYSQVHLAQCVEGMPDALGVVLWPSSPVASVTHLDMGWDQTEYIIIPHKRRWQLWPIIFFFTFVMLCRVFPLSCKINI